MGSSIDSSGGCCYEDGCQSCNPAGHYCDSNDTCSNECAGTWCGPAAPAPAPTPAATGGCCYEDGCQSCNPAGNYCDSESTCTNECKGTLCGAPSNETAALELQPCESEHCCFDPDCQTCGPV